MKYNSFDRDYIVNKTYKILSENLNNKFQVIKDYDYYPLFGDKVHFDIAVFIEGKPYAVFCYNPMAKILINNKRYNHQEIKNRIKLQYYILIGHGEEYYKLDSNTNDQGFSLDDLICMFNDNTRWGIQPDNDVVVKKLIDSVPNEMTSKELVEKFLSNMLGKGYCDFDKNTGNISFKDDYEHLLFKKLLPTYNTSEICRYTTTESLFKFINEGTSAMMSITCMNDKSESYYADSYIYGSYYQHTRSDESVDSANKCFILSCCDISNYDKLTMWRLYGDDGKGACLKYSLAENDIENSNFYLAKVSYSTKGKHPELDFVKKIFELDFAGWTFKFKHWDIWKHFFKSDNYIEENEIRLVYVEGNDNCDTEWIRDHTHGIPTRIAKFKKDVFPLKLTHALIGPKSPEQQTIVEQMNCMNRFKQSIKTTSFRDAISSSKIKDYR